MIYEIKHIINSFIRNGTYVNFLWIPSHCNFRYNDVADIAAKQGARNENSISIEIPLSKNEKFTLIDKHFKSNLSSTNKKIPAITSRYISNVARRIKLNSIKTKYCHSINCKCLKKFSLEHILKECKEFQDIIPEQYRKMPSELDILYCIDIAKILSDTEISDYL